MQTEPWATPEDVRDLYRCEHLLVLALRATALGHADCPAIQRGFAAACGAQGEAARMAFFVLVRQIGTTGSRPLRLHVPGCVCLSPDERAVVTVVAAAQDALATGDDRGLRAHLRTLVEKEPPQGFIDTALSIAGALQSYGHRLPRRLACPPMGCAARTLH